MTRPDYFLDTNLLIYATSLAADHAEKKPLARAWVERIDWGLSTQVRMEFYAQARQPRHGLLPTAAKDFVRQLAATRPEQVVDAILVAARYVISEEMVYGENYDGVTVLNPFLELPA